MEPILMKIFGCKSLKIKFLTCVRNGLYKLDVRIYDKDASHLDLEFLRERILSQKCMFRIEREIKQQINSRQKLRIKRIQFPDLCNIFSFFLFKNFTANSFILCICNRVIVLISTSRGFLFKHCVIQLQPFSWSIERCLHKCWSMPQTQAFVKNFFCKKV